jgi:hypothetical protein
MAATTAPLNLNSILSELASTFAPGGPAEVSGMQNIADQGKLLASQLGGSSALRGLGNTTTGIPTTVFKHVTKAQQDLRSNLMEHHSNILMSLANLMNQQQTQQQQFGLQSGELGLKQLQYSDARQAAKNPVAPVQSAAPMGAPNTASNSGYGFSNPPSIFGNTSTNSSFASGPSFTNGTGSFIGGSATPEFGNDSTMSTLFGMPIEDLMNTEIGQPLSAGQSGGTPDLSNMSLEDLMNQDVIPYDDQSQWY